MKKHVLPSMLILLFLGIALISFCLYAYKHPFLPAPPSVIKKESEQTATVSGVEAFVEHVVDGDTIDVMIDNQKTPIRLIGINAPEKYAGKDPECFAGEAYQYVKQRIEDRQIVLVADISQENKDKYERLLRYVLLPDGTNLNLELIEKGYAREYTYKVPYQYQQEFRSAQETAKKQAVGLWTSCYK